MPIILIKRDTLLNEKSEFNARDAKKRIIGVRAYIAREETADVETADQHWNYVSPEFVGTSFRAFVQATRNGEDFGAAQRSRQFKTEADAVAYVEKRVAASRKAAMKKVTAKSDEWEPLSEAEQEANLAAECKAIREGRPVREGRA